jgi:hypothetical protein
MRSMTGLAALVLFSFVSSMFCFLAGSELLNHPNRRVEVEMAALCNSGQPEGTEASPPEMRIEDFYAISIACRQYSIGLGEPLALEVMVFNKVLGQEFPLPGRFSLLVNGAACPVLRGVLNFEAYDALRREHHPGVLKCDVDPLSLYLERGRNQIQLRYVEHNVNPARIEARFLHWKYEQYLSGEYDLTQEISSNVVEVRVHE